MSTNFRAFLFLALLPVATLLGCRTGSSQEEQVPAANDDREAVFELLDTMREDAFREAFRMLPERSFLRYERTEERAGDFELERMIERLIRHQPGSRSAVIAIIDSVGSFEGGEAPDFLRRDVPTFADLHRHLLPEDPAYATPREAEAFEYTLQGDTLMWGRQVRVASIHARPGMGDDQQIRSVRLYVDPDSQELLALTMQRLENGFLFGENTTMDVRLRPASTSGWVPHVVRVHTELRTALLPRRVFRTVYAFYDFG